MNKAFSNRVLRIERLRGKTQFVCAVRDPEAYKGVKINGCLMSERRFKQFTYALPADTELYIVEILNNKPEVPTQ